jgi:hypothetical protein
LSIETARDRGHSTALIFETWPFLDRGYSGAYFAQKIPQQTVRYMISGIGFAITAVMFYRQIARG